MRTFPSTHKPIVLEGSDERGIPYEIVTPEGVPLLVRIADAGDRASAFLIDAFVIGLGFLVVGLLFLVLGIKLGALGAALGYLFVFLFRNFYFTWFEARRGATPGKKRIGIRVIDARGGPLTFEAVFTRNLLRELEVWLPLAVLLAPDALWPGAPGWIRILCGGWTLILATLPLYNRRRLRAGDLVGGTLVVRQPQAVLLRDVGISQGGAAVVPAGVAAAAERATPSTTTAAAAAPPEFPFTEVHLDVYGTYELQVLEELLRGSPAEVGAREARRVVADKIRKKIGWTTPVPPGRTDAFLRAFYAALRARLEHRMLLGKAKADKHDAGDGGASRTPSQDPRRRPRP